MAQLSVTLPLKAYLDLIAWSEGTSTSPITSNDGYDIIVSGVAGPNRFDDYSSHPFAMGRSPIVVRDTVPPLLSTASGRYQFVLHTWLTLAATHNLKSFSPANQDAACLSLLAEARAYEPIVNGRIEDAIEACSHIWASFPGNLFHQGGRSLPELLDTYHRLLDNFQD